MPESNRDFLPASWWAVAAIIDAYESEAGEEFPDLRGFVERVETPFRKEALVELIKVEVERSWRAGRPKRIEGYLRDFPELLDAKESLEELVQQEYLVRSSAGDVPSAAELSNRFPSLDQSKLLDDEQGIVATIPFGVNPLETKFSGADSDKSQPGGTVQLETGSGPPASGPAGTIVVDSASSSRPSVRDAAQTVDHETAGRGDSSTRDSQRDTNRSAAPVDTPPRPAELESIGRYEIREELGSGSFGQVLRCYDADLKRDVAIKIPLRRGKNVGTRVKEFLHEAQSVARLKHPGIVTVLDANQTDDGRVFIVYEFIEGQTLQNRVKQRDFVFEDAARWVADAAEALQQAHKNGIVHRDIKPANILLDGEGRIYVADFGLATIDDQFFKDDAGKVVGTVAYMSPEQASGKSHWATPQTDIYALGVLLYHLLTGRLPVTAGHVHEALAQIRERQPTPPRAIDDTIPTALEEICLKAMAKSAADRYRTAGDMAADLRQAISAAPPRKTSWSYVAAGGAAAAAAALMLLFAWRDDGNGGPPAPDNVPQAVRLGPPPLELTEPHISVHYQEPAEQGVYHVLRREPLNFLDRIQVHVDLPAHSVGFATPEQVSALDNRIVEDWLADTLAQDGVPLIDDEDARISVLAAESEWQITHAGREYYLRNEEGTLNIYRARYVYLYWYDTNGDLQRLWPTADELHEQVPITNCKYPPGSEDLWDELDAAIGVEIVLLAVSDTPLDAPTLAEFEKYAPYSYRDDIQLDKLDKVYHLVGSGELREELERGLGKTVFSPKNLFSSEFREKLTETFDAYHGMVIPHK